MEKRKNLLITAAYLLLGILAALSVAQGCRNALQYSQDFQWDAAKALSIGIDPYVESLTPTGALDGLGFEEYFSQMEANQFPSLLWLLFPYTLLEPMAARYAWLATNLLMTVLVVWLLRKTFLSRTDTRYFGLICLLMIAGTPWRNQIGVGQHTIFSFAFFLLSVWLDELYDRKGRRGLRLLSALALTVSFFKYTLTVPLALYCVYKKRYPELGIAAAVHVALTVFSAAWLHKGFADMIIEPLKVASALAGEGGIDLGAVLSGSPAAFVLAGIIMAVLLYMMLRMPEGEDELVISLLTLWSLIVTYHRTYDFFVLVVPFCMFPGRRGPGKGLKSDKGAMGFKALFWFYLVLVATVFFVLRLFHEGGLSLPAAGVLYYTFTVCIMVMCMKKIRMRA